MTCEGFSAAWGWCGCLYATSPPKNTPTLGRLTEASAASLAPGAAGTSFALLHRDAHDVAGEVAGARGAQPQLVHAAHGLGDGGAVHVEDDGAVVLQHVGEGEGHLVAVGTGEHDGVGALQGVGVAQQLGHGHAGHLGVHAGDAVGGVTGAGAAEDHGLALLVDHLLDGGVVGMGHGTTDRDGPGAHLGQGTCVGGDGLGAAEVFVGRTHGAGDLVEGRDLALGEGKGAGDLRGLHDGRACGLQVFLGCGLGDGDGVGVCGKRGDHAHAHGGERQSRGGDAGDLLGLFVHGVTPFRGLRTRPWR